MKPKIFFHILLASCILHLASCHSDRVTDSRPLIPLKKGNFWKYQGTHNGQQAVLITKVRETIQRGNLVYATLRGFPSDMLAGQDWEVLNWGLLAVGSQYYYRIEGPRVDTVRDKVLNQGGVCQGLVKDDDLFLVALRDTGQFFGPSSQLSREDGNYFWRVTEKHAFDPSAIQGVPAGGPFDRYTLKYRTTADEVTIDIVPGIGIVGYRYRHFGTPETLDLRLTETGCE